MNTSAECRFWIADWGLLENRKSEIGIENSKP